VPVPARLDQFCHACRRSGLTPSHRITLTLLHYPHRFSCYYAPPRNAPRATPAQPGRAATILPLLPLPRCAPGYTTLVPRRTYVCVLPGYTTLTAAAPSRLLPYYTHRFSILCAHTHTLPSMPAPSFPLPPSPHTLHTLTIPPHTPLPHHFAHPHLFFAHTFPCPHSAMPTLPVPSSQHHTYVPIMPASHLPHLPHLPAWEAAYHAHLLPTSHHLYLPPLAHTTCLCLPYYYTVVTWTAPTPCPHCTLYLASYNAHAFYAARTPTPLPHPHACMRSCAIAPCANSRTVALAFRCCLAAGSIDRMDYHTRAAACRASPHTHAHPTPSLRAATCLALVPSGTPRYRTRFHSTTARRTAHRAELPASWTRRRAGARMPPLNAAQHLYQHASVAAFTCRRRCRCNALV